jgi:hypothetical protein
MDYLLYIIIFIGCLFSISNFYISFISRKKLGSGIPILGSLMIFLSLFFIENLYVLIFILFIALIDTGGIHWFIGTIIYEKIRNN